LLYSFLFLFVGFFSQDERPTRSPAPLLVRGLEGARFFAIFFFIIFVETSVLCAFVYMFEQPSPGYVAPVAKAAVSGTGAGVGPPGWCDPNNKKGRKQKEKSKK
jgi:hypothetical protein